MIMKEPKKNEKSLYVDALKAVKKFLNNKASSYKFKISAVQEFEFGWLFFYQSEEYLRTKDPGKLLGGNAPIIYDIESKCLHVTGTRLSPKYYVTLYRKYRNNTDVFHKEKIGYIPEEWR